MIEHPEDLVERLAAVLWNRRDFSRNVYAIPATVRAVLDALTETHAITELPQPVADEDGTHWPVEQHWSGRPIGNGQVYIRQSDGRISATSTHNPCDCPADARSLAAALLAAARAAEADQ